MSLGALAAGTTAQAGMTWMASRARRAHVVLDLDYRPTMWDSVEAARAVAQQALAMSTVAVGNRQECFMAVGADDPDAAADALLNEVVTPAQIGFEPLNTIAGTTGTVFTVTTIGALMAVSFTKQSAVLLSMHLTVSLSCRVLEEKVLLVFACAVTLLTVHS
jgi:hypothetical protein